MSEYSYFCELSAQVSQIVFLAHLTVLRLLTTVWAEMSENSSPRVKCTSITKRVHSLFDRFTAYYNCISWDVRILINPRVKCTGITNRVLSIFDRFTASYKCRSWNVRKLITPRVPCTIITNRVPSLFEFFASSYNCKGWNIRELIAPRVQCTSITNRVLNIFDEEKDEEKSRPRKKTTPYQPGESSTKIPVVQVV